MRWSRVSESTDGDDAPWGSLAIVHKDDRYSRGLVKLGRIEARRDREQDGHRRLTRAKGIET